jgi:hypothetical protein
MPYYGDPRFIELIEREFPRGFFIRLAEEYEQDYLHAEEFVYERYPEPEAHDLAPYDRRARCEVSTVYVAEQFARHGIKAEPASNATASNYHREVSAGCAVLTQSFARQQGDMIRHADFRDSLARTSRIPLLREPDFKSPPAGTRIYGVVLHGFRRVGNALMVPQLGFFDLAIFDPDDSRQYLAIYNLAKRYANDDIDSDDLNEMYRLDSEYVRKPSILFREYRRLAENE